MWQNSRSQFEVIIPNLNKRFSGITSTVIQVLPHQLKSIRMVSVGYPLPCDIPRIGWVELIRICRKPLPDGSVRIFHARRNNEMIAGLILKTIFRCKLHLIFTSVAQREHTWITKFLYHRMDMLLSPSPNSASFLKREPDQIIPHGTDIKTYHPAEHKSDAWREGGLPGKYGVGIFGRVRPQKGIREYVEALCKVMPEFPDFTAVIIGQTTPKFQSFEMELKDHVRKAGLQKRFSWLGQLPVEEVPLWFRRMTLVVCASHNEGFGLTCLESMASGAPVLATRAGAWELIIREGVDGYLVPCADSEAMEAALRTALASPDRLYKMGHAARERVVTEFTSEKEADSLVQVYRIMLDRDIS